MLVLAVIPQTFAVVGKKNDQSTIVDAERFEPREQTADDVIRLGDLAVVGRLVRRVRLVDVEEEKERLLRVLLDPRQRELQRFVPGALVFADRSGSGNRNAVVVVIESVADACLRAQHVRRYGRSGVIAVRAQHVSQGAELRTVKPISDVVPHAMLGRQQPGEDGGMRGQRHGTVAVCALKKNRVSAKGIEVRRLHSAISVRRQMIRSQRVDGDQHDRRVRRLRLAMAGQKEQRRRREDSAATHRRVLSSAMLRIIFCVSASPDSYVRQSMSICSCGSSAETVKPSSG